MASDIDGDDWMAGVAAPTERTPAQRAARTVDLVWWGTWAALLLAAVSVVDGLMMASEKKVAECPDGKIWPDDATDFTCFSHPQADLGIAIAALSVVLAILVVLASIAARASLAVPPDSRRG